MNPAQPPSRSQAAAAGPALAEPGAADFHEPQTRVPSPWPDSAVWPGGRPGTEPGARPDDRQDDRNVFSTTRFDPVAEERGRLQAQAAAAFDVCHPGLALRAVLLVQGVLAIAALAGADSPLHWAGRQGVAAVAGVAGTLLWLVGVCAARGLLQRLDSAPRALAVLVAGAGCAWLALLPLAWAGLLQPDTDGTLPPGAAALLPGGGWLRAAGALAAGAAFAGMLWAWLDLRSRIWHPANASARLAELQSRIRPHFLFNALNTALALVRVDPARAEAVLEDLAQLFRTALADVGASVPLDEEIELARRYLDIEQIRFGKRLRVHWQLSGDRRVGAARVPPLVLQPLVENAVRHGVEPVPAGGDLHISTSVQRGQVCILVSNTVGGDDGTPGHGMALHNVRERLRLLHDVAAQCDVWREPGLPGAGAGQGGQGGQGAGTGTRPDVFHARIVLPLD